VSGAGDGLAAGSGDGTPHLEVRDLTVRFPITGGVLRRRTGWVHAVEGVSFSVGRGRTLGLVGESGSGKTTTGRAIVRITRPQAGSVRLSGEDLLALDGEALRARRRRFQMVFQDPQSSLDPRQTVAQILSEPLRTHGLPAGGRRPERIAQLLEMVGLDPAFASRYPHEFSGGQRQRIGIARALAVEPELIVCDEPVSALDVSIQAQVLNLLDELQRDLGITYLLVAHDLAVVRHIAHDVAVMYLGRLVEVGEASQLYTAPIHPYTSALLSAVPVPDARAERARRRIILTGDIPSPADPPPGCRFHTRCWLRERLGRPERCQTEEPELHAPDPARPEHRAACHFPSEARAAVGTGTVVPVATGVAASELSGAAGPPHGVDPSPPATQER
jgi:oligopeptide/dipeptide ABC transporter ATP-binding protein